MRAELLKCDKARMGCAVLSCSASRVRLWPQSALSPVLQPRLEISFAAARWRLVPMRSERPPFALQGGKKVIAKLSVRAKKTALTHKQFQFFTTMQNGLAPKLTRCSPTAMYLF